MLIRLELELEDEDFIEPHWDVTAKSRRTGEHDRDRLLYSLSTLMYVGALQLLFRRVWYSILSVLDAGAERQVDNDCDDSASS